MDRCRNFFCVVGLMAFCLASHAFVSGRFGSDRKPAKTGYEVQRGNAAKLFDDASDLLWSATGQALSVGAALGMVFAVTQASVRAEEMKAFGDLESQVTVARIDKTKKVTELKADAKKVDEFTKNKVRTSEEKFREFTKDLDTEFASTERSLRAGPGVRSVVRKSLQKEKPSGLSFTGFEGLPSLPALPALPSISLPGLGGGSGGAPPSENAAVGVLSGAAISLGVPAVLVAGAVNNRIQEKKREDAERRAREKADSTGSILTAVAGIGAAVVVGNFILTNLPPEAPPVQKTTTQSADTAAAQKAAAAKAAADKAAAEKAAADKAAADKAAADKAAADKAAAENASKAAADKAAADKVAADKAAADKAAAEKAAADKAAADKAAAEKAAKAAADKAAADKAAADKAAADKAAADKAAAEKAAKVETPPAPQEESTTAKIAKKGGYFAYMKEKQRQQS